MIVIFLAIFSSVAKSFWYFEVINNDKVGLKIRSDHRKTKQESSASWAVKEGHIRVDQSKLQEEARQQAILQLLKQQQLEAELKVIEQEKINNQAQLELSKILQQVAQQEAQAAIAKEIALAQLYASSPQYVALLVVQANAQAIKDTNKLIFAPEDQFPNLIFTNGLVTSINIPQ